MQLETYSAFTQEILRSRLDCEKHVLRRLSLLFLNQLTFSRIRNGLKSYESIYIGSGRSSIVHIRSACLTSTWCEWNSLTILSEINLRKQMIDNDFLLIIKGFPLVNDIRGSINFETKIVHISYALTITSFNCSCQLVLGYTQNVLDYPTRPAFIINFYLRGGRSYRRKINFDILSCKGV